MPQRISIGLLTRAVVKATLVRVTRLRLKAEARGLKLKAEACVLALSLCCSIVPRVKPIIQHIITIACH